MKHYGWDENGSEGGGQVLEFGEEVRYCVGRVSLGRGSGFDVGSKTEE